MNSKLALAAAVAGAALMGASTAPKMDADTAAWWATTAQLSNDSMEGRDTGSPAYLRAAKLVAAKFQAAGLKPAGEGGSWFQNVPMQEIRVTGARVTAGTRPLVFLHDLTISPNSATPARVDAPLAYGGYCGAGSLGDVRGKVVICHGTHRAGLPSGADREAAVRAAGAVGMLTIADPGFTVEPPRWPFAYARTVTLATDRAKPDPFLRMTLNAASLGKLLAGARRNASALVAAGSAGRPLPSFAIPGRFRAQFTLKQREISSANVLAYMPGSDPGLADQVIVLSAHLDGYGYGEPVNGDRLYNGALDDAAYVALLAQLADRRHGHGFRRTILFAAFTGEEKGLLGSNYFVAHPTVPLRDVAAMINLDQLRPLFPLNILTMLAVNETSLGATARQVAAPMGIRIQSDPEPERGLLQRADHWPFLQAGVPATGFIFGYAPGTDAERRYRLWYRTRYHHPADDVTQPMDFAAAAKFNAFFYNLVGAVADADRRPTMLGRP